MFFFAPNRAKECGQAAIIFFQITSWNFSLICCNTINHPVLLGSSKLSSPHTERHKCIHNWPTFFFFPRPQAVPFGFSFNKYLNLKISKNNGNSELDSELGVYADTQTDQHELKGERALWLSVTSISHLVPYVQNPLCCLRDTLRNQCQSKGEGQPGLARSRPSVPAFLF